MTTYLKPQFNQKVTLIDFHRSRKSTQLVDFWSQHFSDPNANVLKDISKLTFTSQPIEELRVNRALYIYFYRIMNSRSSMLQKCIDLQKQDLDPGEELQSLQFSYPILKYHYISLQAFKMIIATQCYNLTMENTTNFYNVIVQLLGEVKIHHLNNYVNLSSLSKTQQLIVINQYFKNRFLIMTVLGRSALVPKLLGGMNNEQEDKKLFYKQQRLLEQQQQLDSLLEKLEIQAKEIEKQKIVDYEQHFKIQSKELTSFLEISRFGTYLTQNFQDKRPNQYQANKALLKYVNSNDFYQSIKIQGNQCFISFNQEKISANGKYQSKFDYNFDLTLLCQIIKVDTLNISEQSVIKIELNSEIELLKTLKNYQVDFRSAYKRLYGSEYKPLGTKIIKNKFGKIIRSLSTDKKVEKLRNIKNEIKKYSSKLKIIRNNIENKHPKWTQTRAFQQCFNNQQLEQYFFEQKAKHIYYQGKFEYNGYTFYSVSKQKAQAQKYLLIKLFIYIVGKDLIDSNLFTHSTQWKLALPEKQLFFQIYKSQFTQFKNIYQFPRIISQLQNLKSQPRVFDLSELQLTYGSFPFKFDVSNDQEFKVSYYAYKWEQKVFPIQDAQLTYKNKVIPFITNFLQNGKYLYWSNLSEQTNLFKEGDLILIIDNKFQEEDTIIGACLMQVVKRTHVLLIDTGDTYRLVEAEPVDFLDLRILLCQPFYSYQTFQKYPLINDLDKRLIVIGKDLTSEIPIIQILLNKYRKTEIIIYDMGLEDKNLKTYTTFKEKIQFLSFLPFNYSQMQHLLYSKNATDPQFDILFYYCILVSYLTLQNNNNAAAIAENFMLDIKNTYQFLAKREQIDVLKNTLYNKGQKYHLNYVLQEALTVHYKNFTIQLDPKIGLTICETPFPVQVCYEIAKNFSTQGVYIGATKQKMSLTSGATYVKKQNKIKNQKALKNNRLNKQQFSKRIVQKVKPVIQQKQQKRKSSYDLDEEEEDDLMYFPKLTTTPSTTSTAPTANLQLQQINEPYQIDLVSLFDESTTILTKTLMGNLIQLQLQIDNTILLEIQNIINSANLLVQFCQQYQRYDKVCNYFDIKTNKKVSTNFKYATYIYPCNYGVDNTCFFQAIAHSFYTHPDFKVSDQNIIDWFRRVHQNTPLAKLCENIITKYDTKKGVPADLVIAYLKAANRNFITLDEVNQEIIKNKVYNYAMLNKTLFVIAGDHIFLIKYQHHRIENFKIYQPLLCGYEALMDDLVKQKIGDLSISFQNNAQHNYGYMHSLSVYNSMGIEQDGLPDKSMLDFVEARTLIIYYASAGIDVNVRYKNKHYHIITLFKISPFQINYSNAHFYLATDLLGIYDKQLYSIQKYAYIFDLMEKKGVQFMEELDLSSVTSFQLNNYLLDDPSYSSSKIQNQKVIEKIEQDKLTNDALLQLINKDLHTFKFDINNFFKRFKDTLFTGGLIVIDQHEYCLSFDSNIYYFKNSDESNQISNHYSVIIEHEQEIIIKLSIYFGDMQETFSYHSTSLIGSQYIKEDQSGPIIYNKTDQLQIVPGIWLSKLEKTDHYQQRHFENQKYFHNACLIYKAIFTSLMTSTTISALEDKAINISYSTIVAQYGLKLDQHTAIYIQKASIAVRKMVYTLKVKNQILPQQNLPTVKEYLKESKFIYHIGNEILDVSQVLNTNFSNIPISWKLTVDQQIDTNKLKFNKHARNIAWYTILLFGITTLMKLWYPYKTSTKFLMLLTMFLNTFPHLNEVTTCFRSIISHPAVLQKIKSLDFVFFLRIFYILTTILIATLDRSYTVDATLDYIQWGITSDHNTQTLASKHCFMIYFIINCFNIYFFSQSNYLSQYIDFLNAYVETQQKSSVQLMDNDIQSWDYIGAKKKEKRQLIFKSHCLRIILFIVFGLPLLSYIVLELPNNLFNLKEETRWQQSLNITGNVNLTYVTSMKTYRKYNNVFTEMFPWLNLQFVQEIPLYHELFILTSTDDDLCSYDGELCYLKFEIDGIQVNFDVVPPNYFEDIEFVKKYTLVESYEFQKERKLDMSPLKARRTYSMFLNNCIQLGHFLKYQLKLNLNNWQVRLVPYFQILNDQMHLTILFIQVILAYFVIIFLWYSLFSLEFFNVEIVVKPKWLGRQTKTLSFKDITIPAQKKLIQVKQLYSKIQHLKDSLKLANYQQTVDYQKRITSQNKVGWAAIKYDILKDSQIVKWYQSDVLTGAWAFLHRQGCQVSQPQVSYLKQFKTVFDQIYQPMKTEIMTKIATQQFIVPSFSDYLQTRTPDRRAELLRGTKNFKEKQYVTKNFQTFSKPFETSIKDSKTVRPRNLVNPTSDQKAVSQYFSYIMCHLFKEVLYSFVYAYEPDQLKEKLQEKFSQIDNGIFVDFDGKSFDSTQHAELIKIVDNQIVKDFISIIIDQFDVVEIELIKKYLLRTSRKFYFNYCTNRNLNKNRSFKTQLVTMILDGKVGSGLWNTTLGNTLRQYFYMYFLLVKTLEASGKININNINTQLIKDTAVFFVAGDDVVMRFRTHYKREFLIQVSKIYSFQENAYQIKGLGQVIKEQHYSKTRSEFLSKDIIYGGDSFPLYFEYKINRLPYYASVVELERISVLEHRTNTIVSLASKQNWENHPILNTLITERRKLGIDEKIFQNQKLKQFRAQNHGLQDKLGKTEWNELVNQQFSTICDITNRSFYDHNFHLSIQNATKYVGRSYNSQLSQEIQTNFQLNCYSSTFQPKNKKLIKTFFQCPNQIKMQITKTKIKIGDEDVDLKDQMKQIQQKFMETPSILAEILKIQQTPQLIKHQPRELSLKYQEMAKSMQLKPQKENLLTPMLWKIIQKQLILQHQLQNIIHPINIQWNNQVKKPWLNYNQIFLLSLKWNNQEILWQQIQMTCLVQLKMQYPQLQIMDLIQQPDFKKLIKKSLNQMVLQNLLIIIKSKDQQMNSAWKLLAVHLLHLFFVLNNTNQEHLVLKTLILVQEVVLQLMNQLQMVLAI